jgi:hypothetical protein
MGVNLELGGLLMGDTIRVRDHSGDGYPDAAVATKAMP